MMKAKGLIFQQQQQQVLIDQENMSNLTSASGDQASASVSSENIGADHGSTFPQHYFAPPPIQIQVQPPPKKKRNLPGNPDPEAEVITLSPKTLMATNRFVCEVCKKGFQRDQNLQLHRRGHNLPWKLKQRSSKDEVKKKVYVCPEAGCVHHDPSRALGDLTGIKKHFCRKHGEKKWKCDKCSKSYAVQSDWKAHSKTCGTREYSCDCGTLFSRRDSFITHRAFCEALAEESARASTGLNPLLSSHQQATGTHFQVHVPPQFNASCSNIDLQNPFSNLKKEQQNFPPWLACPPGPGSDPPPPIDQTPSSSSSSPPIFNTRLDQQFTQAALNPNNLNSNSSTEVGPILPTYHPTTASAHMSATALLQKAAQMGATISSSKVFAFTTTSPSPSMTMIRPHHQRHVSANSVNTTTRFPLNLSSRDHLQEMALPSFDNKYNVKAPPPPPSPSFFHQDMLMNSLSSGIDHDDHNGPTAFEDALANGFLDAKKEQGRTNEEIRGSGVGGNDGMTRDFLGLRHLSHSDIMTMAGLGNCGNTSSNALGNESQTPRSW